MNSPNIQQTPSSLMRAVAAWVTLIGVVVFVGAYLCLFVYWMYRDFEFFGPIAHDHFQAVIGLRFGALAALCIVLFLEFRSGHMEVQGFGFKFRGASGPAIIWLLCFLGISAAIKMLW